MAEIESTIDSDEIVRDELKKNLQHIEEIKHTNPKQALELARQVREKATELKLLSEQAAAYLCEASCYEHLSDFKQAYFQAEKAIDGFLAVGNIAGQAKAWSMIANIYLQLGIYDHAFECNLKSLTHYESLNDANGIGVVLNNIGLTYFHLGDYQNARRYLEKALAHRQAHQLKKGIAYTLNNLASICEKEDQYEEALALQRKSLDLMHELSDKRGEAAVLCNMANIYASLGQFKSAIDLQHQSIKIEQTLGNLIGEAESLYELGKIYGNPNFQEADDEKAVAYLHAALNKAQQTEEKKLRYKIHKALAECYAKHHDFEKAYYHHCLYHELKETVDATATHQKAKRFGMMMLEMEYEKKLAYHKTLCDELMLANHTLKKTIETKSELISIVTHDLTNPIQAILGYTQLMHVRASEAKLVLKYVAKIEECVSQMQARIHHWLKTTKEESALRQAGKQAINMNMLVKNVIESMGGFLEKKFQQIIYDEQAELMVMADGQLMYEVFENLISNASKYSEVGKTIYVSLERKNTDGLICVRDEGQGLCEEDFKNLFGKFQTLSSKPTMGERSTGIGLYITKQIIERHQGKIWAESEGKGKGTTFFVQLPLHSTNSKDTNSKENIAH